MVPVKFPCLTLNFKKGKTGPFTRIKIGQIVNG